MDGLRVRDVGAVSPLDGLPDVLRLFKAARDWSLDVDEQLRAEGHEPMGATLGMPARQLDAIIVILERAQQRIAATDRAYDHAYAVARRAHRMAGWIILVCSALGVLNLLSILSRWV